MLREVVLVVGIAAVLVAGRSSPHADYVDELLQTNQIGSRYSTNVNEDARLDAPGLIEKYNYPIEVHTVTTEDGYILEMHRIPHGRDANNFPDSNKPVVFLMHGLLSSSADWVNMGPGKGMGYILAEEGYDVWMGNARGNYYSRKHIRLNPDGILNTSFWEFSWDEIGNLDLPAMINYALTQTNKQGLHYIGHSQGTTSFFVMGSLRPEMNEKIISMHALAPVAFMAHNSSPFLGLISPYANQIEALASLIGIGEFMPNTALTAAAGQILCSDQSFAQAICSGIMFQVGGYNPEQHNATMLPVKLAHTPAGAAVRQFAHYGQGIAGGGFRRYSYGTLRNLRVYGSVNPPTYDLSKITAPVFLHYSDSDPLAHVNDVFRLNNELGRSVGLFRIALASFSHLDFVWGIDAKSLVYDRVITLMKTMDRP